jgi:stage V sporulation protein D (sporulation-specific penicillin-binding protein)
MKIKLIFGCFILFFIVISIKLFYLQILAPHRYTADYVTTHKVFPERGKILDRNQKPLALNQTTYRLFVEPEHVDNRYELIKKIDSVLQIGESTLEGQIDMKKKWISIRGNLPKETKEKLDGLNLKGIGFDLESSRYYPEASLSAHILGFVGKIMKVIRLDMSVSKGFMIRISPAYPVLLSQREILLADRFFLAHKSELMLNMEETSF